MSKEEEQIFYICDGEDPHCRKSKNSLCWKYGENDGTTMCHRTSDISHAVNFHKSKQMGYYAERYDGDSDLIFKD